MKQIKTKLMPFLFTALFVLAVFIPAPVAAEMCGSEGGKEGKGVETSIIVGCGGDANPIYAYSRGIIRFLAVVVGLVVVGAVIVGGIAYASARDNKAQVEKAIEIIRNAIIGLLLFIGMSAILNFIIPGGII